MSKLANAIPQNHQFDSDLYHEQDSFEILNLEKMCCYLYQYAFRTNKSTEDALSTALHSLFTSCEQEPLHHTAVLQHLVQSHPLS